MSDDGSAAEVPGAVLAPAPWPSLSGTRITAVRCILTAPQGPPYVIVRVETNEPGLYGLGCASDPQRTTAVHALVTDYLGPLVVGRDPADIEDIHRLMAMSGYWRGGSVAHNAMAGIDVALWDIAGKAAGRPVHDLLGGRVRAEARVYGHAHGTGVEDIAEAVAAFVAAGYDHVRVQFAVAGSDSYGTGPSPTSVDRRTRPWDGRRYARDLPHLLQGVRDRVGDEVELLHDVHERLTPAEARRLVREIEPARLFFLEDALAPEDAHHFPDLKAAGTTPLAMGELFSDARDYLPLITSRSIDFARLRVPTLGGLTPTRKLAVLCELFGARTAAHGPGDVSPVGMAATLALDVSSPAFGIQEATPYTEATREVFPGTPTVVDGALRPGTGAGLGIDLDEAAARRYPPPPPLAHDRWALLRTRDGAVHRP